MRLSELVLKWFGRVEIVIAGAEGFLREAEEALAMGDAMRARRAAHAILERAPNSILGLALLADACELAGLQAELVQTLEDLAPRLGMRPDVWLRLGHARARSLEEASEVRAAFLHALSLSQKGSEAREQALLALIDLDISAQDALGAQARLDELASQDSADGRLRRIEILLLRGAHAEAVRELEHLVDDPTSGRAALARGRALSAVGNAAAYPALLRAYVLDVEGASEALSAALGYVPADAETQARAKAVVEAKGEAGLLRFAAGFSRAAGDRAGAKRALMNALAGGDASARVPLFHTAMEECDIDALRASLTPTSSAPVEEDARLVSAAFDSTPHAMVTAPYALKTRFWTGFEDVLRTRALAHWVPRTSTARWSDVLGRLAEHARALEDYAQLQELGTLAVEVERPLRLAIVGEFNAGKSTFINALLGADIAPTGILPTTGTLHHLRYGKDRIAKIVTHEGRERLIPSPGLRMALGEFDVSQIRRVEIMEPLDWLVEVELLDTPGFNAPDPAHALAARQALTEADAVLWLLDATQPFKDTERRVLQEIHQARTPIQILVNKRDRLSEENLDSVMAMVAGALKTEGITPLAAPVALSTKLALAGKLGDSAALQASNFASIEALLNDVFLGRARELKEAAMRRRVLRSVGHLGSLASRATERLAAERNARAHRIESTRAHISKVAADSTRYIETGRGIVDASLQRLASDIATVGVGREAESAQGQARLRSYLTERALVTLKPSLARVLTSLLDVTEPLDDALTALTIAYCQTVELRATFDAAPLLRAVLRVVEEYVRTPAVADDRTAELRARELVGFADALAQAPLNS